MQTIPEDFSPLDTSSPFITNVGPLQFRAANQRIDIGLLIEEIHCNRGGRIHGAMVCAIADIALGQNVSLALSASGAYDKVKDLGPQSSPIATVSMSTDFAGTAVIGDWVETYVEVQRAGRSMAFANAYLVCKGERIARTSGVYKVVGK